MNSEDELDLIPLDEDRPPLTTWRVVLISALVALVIGCLPALTTALVVGDNLKAAQDGLKAQQKALIESRVKSAGLTCKRINAIITQSRTQTEYLQHLIVNGARQSKSFEKTFRQLHLPPYEKRLAQAEKQAAGLAKTSPHLLDCADYVKRAKLQR